ncbi:hypothetical protein M8C21_033806 [Ambrosia artemisiifolia]|uniref:SPX domain-containing protein n=1 Tax=Ambrosia artemisiifolia TaxID=4212 RepID=A0AAD5BUP2_AMBAR|nr:hypothetical protein M8C21_033806 [Ambrosia artemisiifolia]
MVKFSKELEAQLIPEWKDAFVNYWVLKKHVKKVKLSRISKPNINDHDYGVSIFDPVRSFIRRLSSCNATNNDPPDHMLQVRNTSSEVQSEEGEDEEDDETELVDHLYSEEDEVKEFFEKLDEELDKVNQFYMNKESEFLERGDMLKKQLQILLDLQQLVDCRRRSNSFNSTASSGFLRSYSSGRTSDSGIYIITFTFCFLLVDVDGTVTR